MADEGNQPVNDGAAPAAPVSDLNAGAPAPSIALADLTAAGIPDTFIKDGALDAKALAESITEAASLKAAAAERAAGIPADGKYDFALPKDFKLPDGVKLPEEFLKSWNVSDAKAKQFAEYAKQAGYSQTEVTEFVRNWALADIADKVAAGQAAVDAQKREDDAVKADAEKLFGPNYTATIEATRNAYQAFLVENLGKEAGERLAKNTGFQSAADIKALGDLMNAVRTKMASKAPTGGTDSNAEAVALVGTPGGSRKLLNMANSKASN